MNPRLLNRRRFLAAGAGSALAAVSLIWLAQYQPSPPVQLNSIGKAEPR